MRIFDNDYTYEENMGFEEYRDLGTMRYIYSSERRKHIPLDGERRYDPDSKRWYSTVACGYVCEDDMYAFLEADEMDVFRFWEENPDAKHKVTYEHLWFGDKEDGVEFGSIIAQEFCGSLCRSVEFCVRNISFEELERLEQSLMHWHLHGELLLDAVELELGNWEKNTYWRERDMAAEKSAAEVNLLRDMGRVDEDPIPFA